MINSINLNGVKVPNPRALKFAVANITLAEGAYDFTRETGTEASPLARNLLTQDYIERVFISQNFVTVTLVEEGPKWDEVMASVRILIKRHLELGEPVLIQELAPPSKEGNKGKDHLAIRIKAVIDQQIRPATRQDGGDMTFQSYEEGVVKVSLAGACVGCPFAPRTIKHGIEVLLKRNFEEVVEVTSDEVEWED